MGRAARAPSVVHLKPHTLHLMTPVELGRGSRPTRAVSAHADSVGGRVPPHSRQKLVFSDASATANHATLDAFPRPSSRLLLIAMEQQNVKGVVKVGATRRRRKSGARQLVDELIPLRLDPLQTQCFSFLLYITLATDRASLEACEATAIEYLPPARPHPTMLRAPSHVLKLRRPSYRRIYYCRCSNVESARGMIGAMESRFFATKPIGARTKELLKKKQQISKNLIDKVRI